VVDEAAVDINLKQQVDFIKLVDEVEVEM